MADPVRCPRCNVAHPAGFPPMEEILAMLGLLAERSSPDRFPFLGMLRAHCIRERIQAAGGIDHRSLLVKYIRHAKSLTFNGEGFIFPGPPGGQPFTDTEWAELQRLAEEAERG